VINSIPYILMINDTILNLCKKENSIFKIILKENN